MSLEREIMAAWRMAIGLAGKKVEVDIAVKEVLQQAVEQIAFKLDEAVKKPLLKEREFRLEFTIDGKNNQVIANFYYTSTTQSKVDLGTAKFTFRKVSGIETELQKREIICLIYPALLTSSSSSSSSSALNPNNLIPTDVPANLAIDATFSNSKLRQLLEADVVVPDMLKRVAAEERLRAVLLRKAKAAAKIGGARYHGQDITFAEVKRREGGGFQFHDPKDKLGEMIEKALEYCAKNSDAISDKYADICHVLADLLEKPSIDKLDELVQLASEVKRHPEWVLIIGGIIIAAMGIFFASSVAWCLVYLAGIVPIDFLFLMGAIIMPAAALAIIGGGGAMAICNAIPREHSAELHKVKEVAKELPELKPPSFSFSTVFSREPEVCIVHVPPAHPQYAPVKSL